MNQLWKQTQWGYSNSKLTRPGPRLVATWAYAAAIGSVLLLLLLLQLVETVGVLLPAPQASPGGSLARSAPRVAASRREHAN